MDDPHARAHNCALCEAIYVTACQHEKTIISVFMPILIQIRTRSRLFVARSLRHGRKIRIGTGRIGPN